jgi:hypothetical protein
MSPTERRAHPRHDDDAAWFCFVFLVVPQERERKVTTKRWEELSEGACGVLRTVETGTGGAAGGEELEQSAGRRQEAAAASTTQKKKEENEVK